MRRGLRPSIVQYHTVPISLIGSSPRATSAGSTGAYFSKKILAAPPVVSCLTFPNNLIAPEGSIVAHFI